MESASPGRGSGTVLVADGGLVSLLVEIDVAEPEDGGDDLEE
jgi:hypothetical protein